MRGQKGKQESGDEQGQRGEKMTYLMMQGEDETETQEEGKEREQEE